MKKKTNKQICEEQKVFILENWDKHSHRKMAELVGVPETSYRMYVRELGLSKQKHKAWTEEEVQFLLDNYKTMGDMEIGQHLNRSNKSICKKRRYLKLKRTKRQASKIRKKNGQRKGFGTGYGIATTKHHRAIGERWKIKDCPYWLIKTEYGIYFEHRWLWIWNFGEIDKCSAVVFKDDNPDNLDLDNLALMNRNEISVYNRRASSEANKKAQQMTFMERIYAGYIPHDTPKGTVYY